MAAQQRPLSPHLTIHPQRITGGMSIFHRITGVVLAFGALVLAAWLLAVAGGGESYAAFAACASSPLGKLALLVFAAALVYHLLNGIRHLLWDVGWGFEIPKVYASGYTVMALTVVITAAIAWVGLSAGGAA